MSERIGIIGGTGFCEMKELKNKKWVKVSTPFGKPSDDYLIGELNGRDVVFLARHARGHRLLPGEINYKANVYGMKKLGVYSLVGTAAVGSFREQIKPLDFVIPDQVLDRTTQRDSTFFGDGIAAHIGFADPFCKDLCGALARVCRQLNIPVHEGGTYLNMEGPAFSSRAESTLYRSWGMDIIGMTNLIEAKLAREAEMCYATLAMVTDYDCWHAAHEDVTVDIIVNNLSINAENAHRVIFELMKNIPEKCCSGCQQALATAIVTKHDAIPAAAKKRLKLLIGKYL